MMQVWCFGDFCQGSMPSKYGGLQCTMIALFALALSYMLPCNEWNTTTMNDALTHGNNMYTSYIDNYMNGIPQYLAHDQLEILHNMDIMGTIVEPTIHSNLFYGAVGINPETDSFAASLTDALETSFQLSTHVLVTFNDLSIALMAQNGEYFLFDSHARNAFGQTSEVGTSVLLHFESLSDLTTYFVKVYYGHMFNISPVQFASQCVHTSEANNMNASLETDGINEMEVMHCKCVGNSNCCLHECRNDTDDSSVSDQAKHNCSVIENISSSNSISKVNIGIHSPSSVENQEDTLSSVDDQGDTEGMEIETEYTLHQPNIIRIECDDVQKAINPFIDHGYHKQYCDMVSVTHDHRYCQNISSNSNFCGDHYLPYEKYIQENMNNFCSVCHRLLFKDKCYFRTMNGARVCFCSSCYAKNRNGESSSIAWSNNMDPGEIPNEIKELKKIERRFVALIHVFMTVFLLPQNQQLGTKGIAINIPASPGDFMNSVGLSPGVFISFESRTGTDHDLSHLISTERIYKALAWLKIKNRLYHGIKLPECSSRNQNTHDYTTHDIDECIAVDIDDHLPATNEENMSAMNFRHIRLPRVNASIVNAYDIPNGEEMCFPWLFPYGKSGYTDLREKDSMFASMYPKARFMGKDDRFRKDMMYLLHYANVYERRMLLSSVNIHMKMKVNNNDITVGQLQNFDYKTNSYMFMSQVRGCAGYFKNKLIDLLSFFHKEFRKSSFILHIFT